MKTSGPELWSEGLAEKATTRPSGENSGSCPTISKPVRIARALVVAGAGVGFAVGAGVAGLGVTTGVATIDADGTGLSTDELELASDAVSDGVAVGVGEAVGVAVAKGVAVGAIVGCGVRRSIETVGPDWVSGRMAILSVVQTAATLAFGASAAETLLSLVIIPSV
jgi:hypothetical protein